MALDATIEGATANSYVSLAQASTYFEDRLDTDLWDTAEGDGTAAPALIMATRILEHESYQGCRTTSTQALAWPRSGVAYEDRWGWWPSDAIPACVQQAQCELALALLKEPDQLSASGLEGFSILQLGALNVTPKGINPTLLPPYVKRLLRPVLVAGIGIPVHRA